VRSNNLIIIDIIKPLNSHIDILYLYIMVCKYIQNIIIIIKIKKFKNLKKNKESDNYLKT
jgi:hypothetical protein